MARRSSFPHYGKDVVSFKPRFPAPPKLRPKTGKRKNDSLSLPQKIIRNPFVRTAARAAFNLALSHVGLKPAADFVQAVIAGFKEFRKTGSLKKGIKLALNQFALQQTYSAVSSVGGSTEVKDLFATNTPIDKAQRVEKLLSGSNLPRGHRLRTP